MRASERKGAWALLVCILILGALLWGLGGRRIGTGNDPVQTQVEIIASPSDSMAEKTGVGKKKGGKHRKGRKSGGHKRKGEDRSESVPAHVRDILGDTIPQTGSGHR